jgi:hypothetical protein
MQNSVKLMPGEQVKAREEVKVVLKNVDSSVLSCDLVLTSIRVLLLCSGAARVPIVVHLAALDTIQVEQLVGRSNRDIGLQLELSCRDMQVVTVCTSKEKVLSPVLL